MTIPVSIARRLTGFKIRAAKPRPMEFVGFLIGRHEGGSYEVLDIWYPADWRKHAAEGQVEVQDEWWREAMEFARRSG
jgi:hypothetical protein